MTDRTYERTVWARALGDALEEVMKARADGRLFMNPGESITKAMERADADRAQSISVALAKYEIALERYRAAGGRPMEDISPDENLGAWPLDTKEYRDLRG